MTIHVIRLKKDTRCVIILVKSTTTRWVLEGPEVVVAADLGGGATRTSTISNRASVATTTDHAVRPISAVFFLCWLLSITCTSRQILERSTSLSSGKESIAILMASWMGLNQSASMARFKE
jgi:hypothetical protein